MLLSCEQERSVNNDLETEACTTAKMKFLSTEMRKATDIVYFSGERRPKFQFGA